MTTMTVPALLTLLFWLPQEGGEMSLEKRMEEARKAVRDRMQRFEFLVGTWTGAGGYPGIGK